MQTKSREEYSHPRDFPFWIQRNRHDLQDVPELHVHEFVELIFVVEGRATHLFQDIYYEVTEGDVFVINPGEAHGYSLKEDQSIEIVNCLFEPRFIPTSLLRELQVSNSMDFFYVQPLLNGEARFYHKLNLCGSDAAAALDISESILAEMKRRRSGFQPSLCAIQAPSPIGYVKPLTRLPCPCLSDSQHWPPSRYWRVIRRYSTRLAR
ncbi:AraC family ligand binding domain-containing protein [Paenibacillus mesophilus]|uniref:AraC family ligand binding domain-containing protein n=1 Tax=Paenibacillus mesophilus TaxID=2582849 RepID=UPI00130517C2|nr:AraC family ligand binding domain-containing protein [Paenibacillus mesophilus]